MSVLKIFCKKTSVIRSVIMTILILVIAGLVYLYRLNNIVMKNVIVILFAIICTSTSAQELKDLSFVSPFHEDLAAVQKEGQWGFINKSGELVIDFRSDVFVPSDKKAYPMFSNGLCLITKEIKGIEHLGYMDTSGKTVIKPELINAAPFHHNNAIVLKVAKEVLGENELLGKKVVSYAYNEVVIDASGETVKHLRGPVNLLYDKAKLSKAPEIKSHFISELLIAVPSEDESWMLIGLN